jgi:hypothetical protein
MFDHVLTQYGARKTQDDEEDEDDAVFKSEDAKGVWQGFYCLSRKVPPTRVVPSPLRTFLKAKGATTSSWSNFHTEQLG